MEHPCALSYMHMTDGCLPTEGRTSVSSVCLPRHLGTTEKGINQGQGWGRETPDSRPPEPCPHLTAMEPHR